MIRGIYSSISSLVTLEKKQGVITNNLMNVTTPGFKSDELIISEFEKVMVRNRDGSSNSRNNLGNMSIGSKIDSTRTKFDQAGIKQTDRYTDFALIGGGFFTVRDGGSEYYTRDGSFLIDDNGNLKTSTGASVMGTNVKTGAYEPINLGRSLDISVDNLNNIIGDNGSMYRMRISEFEDYTKVYKVRDNLYMGEGVKETLNTQVKNNILESSDVNPASEMVNLTNTLRSFESSMKVLGYLDESLKISANDIGRV